MNGDGRSLRLDDRLASLATHCCLWTGCSNRCFLSRAELVTHVESEHVDGARSCLPDDGSDDGTAGSTRQWRRARRRGWLDGHSRSTAGAFHCGWSGCPRRWQPFNARYKLLIHTRIHTGDKPHQCTVSVNCSNINPMTDSNSLPEDGRTWSELSANFCSTHYNLKS